MIAVLGTYTFIVVIHLNKLPLSVGKIPQLLGARAPESRPYSQALFLGVPSTFQLVASSRGPGVGSWIMDVLSLAEGLYTQPFGFFLSGGHLVWAVSQRPGSGIRLAWQASTAGAFAVALFAPWFLMVRGLWLAGSFNIGYSIQRSWKTPLLLREFLGAGYVGSSLFLAAMLSGALVSVLCVLIADALFDYFLAVRRVIFILPGVVLLAAEALPTAHERCRGLSTSLVALLLTTAVAGGCSILARERDDWQGH